MVAQGTQTQIVTLSFAIEGGSGDTQTAIQNANEFINAGNMPDNWRLVNVNVRDPQYASELLHTLASN